MIPDPGTGGTKRKIIPLGDFLLTIYSRHVLEYR